jgi:hypothetical protein
MLFIYFGIGHLYLIVMVGLSLQYGIFLTRYIFQIFC